MKLFVSACVFLNVMGQDALAEPFNVMTWNNSQGRPFYLKVMQRKSCWIADAESTVSGQATTTGPDWQQPMTIRNIRTANDQTLG